MPASADGAVCHALPDSTLCDLCDRPAQGRLSINSFFFIVLTGPDEDGVERL